MRIVTGPRPWSIRLFAISFSCVASIGLYLALNNQLFNLFAWSKRLPMIAWDNDLALIASFTMFTIALIPILWIFVLGAKRARWVVFTFGTCKLVLWFHGWSLVTYDEFGEALRLLEPVLIGAALLALFLPPSTQWLSLDREISAATFS